MFTRSFDDPAKLYLPGERNRAEREAAAAAEAAEIAEREHKAAQNNALAERKSQEAEPPKPAEEAIEFTQSRLDAAREEGYIAGHTAALEEAETAREHYIADAVNLIAQGLDGLQDRQDDANKQTVDLAMRMVFAVVQRLLPEHTHHYAVDNMEAFVRRALPLAMDKPRLTVRAHAMIAPDLEVKLKEVFTRATFQGTYAVIPDYELQPGDCKLEWEGGGADRDEGRIWADIREVIAANIGDANADDLDKSADTAAEQTAAEQTEIHKASQDTSSEPSTENANKTAPEELRMDVEEEAQELEESSEDLKV